MTDNDKKRVLIVEDEEGLIEGLEHNFKFEGYDVLTARYGLPADGLAARCLVAVRVADHLVGLAFRDEPDGDRRLLGEAKMMICRYLGV